MALSGTIKTNTITSVSNDTFPRYLVLEWSATQSVANNTSTISYTIKAGGTNTGRYCTTGNISVSINGTNVYTQTSRFDMYSQQVLKTGTITVNHSSDGTKQVAVSIQAAIYEFAVNSTYSGSITLDTIARASSVSCSTANIGANPTITISSASSSFKHTLRYVFGSLSGTIVEKTALTTYTAWTIPTSFYAIIPNAKSGKGTIYCDTYNGSTPIGTKSVSFTVNVANSYPTVSPVVVDTDSATLALTGNNKKFIRYYSDANFNINASPKNSATINVITVVNGAQSTNKGTGTFANIESDTFRFNAVDSRGFGVTEPYKIDLINYIKLTCTIGLVKSTADGKIEFSVNGNYFSGSFGAQSNTLTVQYRYKQNNGSYGDWISVSPDVADGKYSVLVSLEGMDYQANYVFQARAIDKLASAESTQLPITIRPVFDWGAADFNVNVPFKMNGETILRHNETANNTVLSASGGSIYVRPGGTNETGNEIRITPQGNIEMNGDILLNGKSLLSILRGLGVTI